MQISAIEHTQTTNFHIDNVRAGSRGHVEWRLFPLAILFAGVGGVGLLGWRGEVRLCAKVYR